MWTRSQTCQHTSHFTGGFSIGVVDHYKLSNRLRVVAVCKMGAGGTDQQAVGSAWVHLAEPAELCAVRAVHAVVCCGACRAESSGGFDPTSVGMSEKEAANIALAFGQVGNGSDGDQTWCTVNRGYTLNTW